MLAGPEKTSSPDRLHRLSLASETDKLSMIFLLRQLRRRTDAQDLIEYGLLIGVVTVTVVLAIADASEIVTNMYTTLLSILNS